jgi:hypothetical protein
MNSDPQHWYSESASRGKIKKKPKKKLPVLIRLPVIFMVRKVTRSNIFSLTAYAGTGTDTLIKYF